MFIRAHDDDGLAHLFDLHRRRHRRAGATVDDDIVGSSDLGQAKGKQGRGEETFLHGRWDRSFRCLRTLGNRNVLVVFACQKARSPLESWR